MSYAVSMPQRGTFEAWREAARLAASHRIAPSELDWSGETGLFAPEALPKELGPHSPRVPAEFLKLAKSVLWHSDKDRFSLLYQALWRLDQGDRHTLLSIDPMGRRLQLMAKSVSRDIHKMHAFVRFREVSPRSNKRHFAAWFEPEHNTLEPSSSFFANRFHDMDWVIATPTLSAIFHDGKLRFTEGGQKPDLPEDAAADLWDTYFANIFNPARVKLDAMRAEMPKKYWKNMPETRLIPDMLRDAEARVARMQAAGASTPRSGAEAISTRYRASMPKAPELPQTLAEAQLAAQQCQRCGLCEMASQTVWGEGAPDARLMIVGEQPGDHEDLTGRPFVGPAGQLLREAMQEAGLIAAQTWMTNAVKHFKFKPKGRERLHQTPDRNEIEQCRWWVGLELAFVAPQLTLALGASAAYSLTGDASPMGPRRGQIETGLHGGPVLISWHPSYILRLRGSAQKAQARRELVEDLTKAHTLTHT